MRPSRTGAVLAATAIVAGALAPAGAAAQTQFSVSAAAATALPELTGATVGATTTNGSGASAYDQTTVTFAFDSPVTAADPKASDFHLVGFDANWRVDGQSAAVQPDGSSVLVTFGASGAPIGAQQVADTAIASVNDGAVTGSTGTNPDGSVPLGSQRTLSTSAGVTAAPDLLSVSAGQQPTGNLTQTDVDFTFDQPAFSTGSNNGYLVFTDGSPKSTCTYDSGSGTTTLTMLCDNEDVSGTSQPGTTPITQQQIARAYVDPRLVSADPQNSTAGQSGPEGTVNPLESVTVGAAGASPTPYLKGLVYQPGVSVTTSGGTTVTADQVKYAFDQPVDVGSGAGNPNCGVGTPTPQPTGACFLLAKADGSEVWGADPNNAAPAISGNGPRVVNDSNGSPTIVLVTFPAGTLSGVVGGAVTDGAVDKKGTTTTNDGSWFPKAAGGSVTRVPGTTNGPILIGLRTTSSPSPASATYVFDQDLTSGSTAVTPKDFYLADADGTKLQCQTATVASGFQPGSNNTVTCTSYTVQVSNGGAATDTQITQATEGYVDHNAVTSPLPPETTASNSPRATQNPETAFVITGPPVITALDPTNGSTAGGTTVTITGANFAKASAVDFGSTPATSFTVDNATKITAISPPHDIGAVDVTVTTPQGSSQTDLGDTFTYVTPSEVTPQVTALAPSRGPTAGSTQVRISGSGFDGATGVDFGSRSATFQVVDDKTIDATAPAHSAGPVNVTVVAPGGASPHSSADVYTYTRTTITATLHCRSPRKHVVKCKAKERPGFSGLKVVFKKRVHHQWKKWDVRRTNSLGNATLVKRHLRSGKRLEIKAVVQGNNRVARAKAGPVRLRVR